HRSERELLEEMLGLVRNFGRLLPSEIERWPRSMTQVGESLEEAREWISTYLREQGDDLKTWSIQLVEPDQYEYTFSTANGLEFSRTFPSGLSQDELALKTNYWFLSHYRR